MDVQEVAVTLGDLLAVLRADPRVLIGVDFDEESASDGCAE